MSELTKDLKLYPDKKIIAQNVLVKSSGQIHKLKNSWSVFNANKENILQWQVWHKTNMTWLNILIAYTAESESNYNKIWQ